MTRLASLRHLRIAAFAAGAVAVAGAAVLVTASAAGLSLGFRPSGSSQPSGTNGAASFDQASSSSSVCADFISHMASDLGKSRSQVESAVDQAIRQTLADQVKAGKLTQAQATRIRNAIAGRPPCTLVGRLGRKANGGPRGQLGAYTTQLLAAAAVALGITPAQLQSELMSGETLSQIAAAQNPPVTEAQFRTKLIAQLKPLLDSAVSAGKLTSAQEQTIFQRLQTGPIPFWNVPLRAPRTGMAAPAATPSTT